MTDVIVIGAGLTGLACAHRLRRFGLDTLVLETSDRVGGVIRSEQRGPYRLEHGPNSLVPTAHTFALIEETGIDSALVESNPRAPRYVVVNGHLKAIPLGPLTIAGLTRAVLEPFVRSKGRDEESIQQFFTRRFGAETHDRLVAPFVSGVYAGDTSRLSVAAAFPRVIELEQQYGSVSLGMLRGRSRAAPKRRATVSSFANGMETLPQALAKDLNISLQATNIRIGKDLQAKATVIAAPAYRAAEILERFNPELSALLMGIEYAPIVVATTSLAESSMKTPLRGFGFLVPPAERFQILGTIFSSVLFPGRAPEGRALLTTFIGGALHPEAFDWPDERVWDVVGTDLKKILQTSLRPEPVALFRHRRAIPQYNIGHLRRTQAIAAELRKHPGLFMGGNFMNGVSVPACLENGDNLGRTVAEYVRSIH